MIEISRTQDEEVGDGTTSVIILGMFLSIFFLQLMLYFSCFIITSMKQKLTRWILRLLWSLEFGIMQF